MKSWIYVTFLVTMIFMFVIYDSHADQIQIPSWIKNNAKWWSKEQIGDYDFVKGIQYLIQSRIMQLPPQQSQSTTIEQPIPIWVKNNAGWWANGTIGDEDFVKGIQYLIYVNIIHVNYLQTFTLSSPVFENNGTIPIKYTCDGDNIFPPLTITGVPTNAKTLALIVDDVDAPGRIFTHWIVWNIPANNSKIAEDENMDFPQGVNSAGKLGYHGPCPPYGPAHRYYFKLYALGSLLNLDSNATKSDLEQSMNSHIISETELMGKYMR